MKTNKKKSSAIAGAAFVNWGQVLGGGCNWGIADIRIYHHFWEGFKSGDMLELSAKSGVNCFDSCQNQYPCYTFGLLLLWRLMFHAENESAFGV